MRLKVALYHSGASHQVHWLDAFAEGVRRDGHQVDLAPAGVGYRKADVGVFWGIRQQALIARCDPYVVLERGYVGDRTQNTAVGIGGLNNRADFNNGYSHRDRWDKLGIELKPWRTGGDYWLVIGQVSGDMSLAPVNGNLDAWYRYMTDKLGARGDYPVRFRHHPLSAGGRRNPPLSDDLAKARGVITFNSNTGVDAVLAGVPTLCADLGSMVWDIAARSVDRLVDFDYPDRTRWACDLAYTQWTYEEIKAGEPWQHIKPALLEHIECLTTDIDAARSRP